MKSQIETEPAAEAVTESDTFGFVSVDATGSAERDPDYEAFQNAMLRVAFGSPLPLETLQMWGRLAPDRRRSAIRRLSAMLRWDHDKENGRKVDVADVARELDISVNRVYRMRRDWAADRSLASLGAFAGSPVTRTGQYQETVTTSLKQTASELIENDPGSTVEDIVDKMRTAAPDAALPKHSTLRNLARQARRRLPPKALGRLVAFDCSAMMAADELGNLHTAFMVLDPINGFAFGASLGNVEASREAYSRCATSALATISGMSAPWAESFEKWTLVAGVDLDMWQGLNFDGPPATMSLNPVRRYGLVIGRAIGPRLDTISFRPAATGSKGLPTTRNVLPVVSEDEMMQLLTLELEKRNEEILVRADSISSRAPRGLFALLEAVAKP